MACVAARLCKAVLMQRGFYATQDSYSPRNALRVADKQSFGLLVSFLLRLRRLASRAGCGVMTRLLALPIRTRQRRAPPVLIVGRTSLRKNLSIYASVRDLSMSQLGHYIAKKLSGLPDRWTTTAGRSEQAQRLRLSQSDPT